jgi:hypothetical protein
MEKAVTAALLGASAVGEEGLTAEGGNHLVQQRTRL